MATTPLYPGYEIPEFKDLKEWQGFYTNHWASLTEAQHAKYEPYLKQLNSLIGYNKDTGLWDQSKWPTYSPTGWATGTSAYDAYREDESGMDALLAQMASGPMSSTDPEVMTEIAARYGMSLASWTGMTSGILDAEGMLTKADELAAMPSEYKSSQEKADRVAQRAAADAMGKKLEAIFGEKGTSAGFAAAYDLTLQMSNQFMQQRAQRELTNIERAFAAVEAQNGYYQKLISEGAMAAEDYIKFRWDSLAQAKQAYEIAMANHIAEYEKIEGIKIEQVKAEADRIIGLVNSITSIMATMMGEDEMLLKTLSETLTLTPAPEEDPMQDTVQGIFSTGGAAIAAAGGVILTSATVATALTTAGIATAAVPGLGIFLLAAGGIFWLVGQLMG